MLKIKEHRKGLMVLNIISGKHLIDLITFIHIVFGEKLER